MNRSEVVFFIFLDFVLFSEIFEYHFCDFYAASSWSFTARSGHRSTCLGHFRLG